MNNKQLRDYQQEMLDRLHEAWQRHQNVMVQMPMGTGKTHLMAAVIISEKRKVKSEKDTVSHSNILIVAHRRELIEQIRKTLDLFGIGNEDGMVTVTSIQKLTAEWKNDKGTEKNPFSLIIIDEAHHAVAKTYRMLWERWPEAKFLGLTATPCRLNQSAFTDLFDTLLTSYSIQEFIDKGWLSDFEYISVTPDNILVERIAGLKKRGVDGDYQTKEMATVMDIPESIAHLYNSYVQYVKDKKGIVYAISREHAQHISDYYSAHDVKCCWIDSRTPMKERQRLVEDYRHGEMDVIVNVDIFSEGFDCPEVEFIQLARPTLSLSKYLQQVGRGMRRSPGKDYVMILDQVGMYQTFGMPTEDRNWELMFRGKVSGRGQQGSERGYVIRDEGNERQLLNLEMVRIKRHGEKNTGVEIFIKGGKYGVMNDGKVICAPEFEKIKRLEAPYFALGIYPYIIYKNKVDIIDMNGHVLRPGLYGNVQREQDMFIGEDITGRKDYWDAKGGRHYRQRPTFEHIGRFEVARVGEQVYMRQSSKQWEKPIDMDNLYLHDGFYIIGNMLIFRKDITKAYEICGYERGYIHIKYGWRDDRDYPYACVSRFGNISSFEKTLPSRLSQRPLNIGMLGMKRMRNLG